jgi:hypothetical protein
LRRQFQAGGRIVPTDREIAQCAAGLFGVEVFFVLPPSSADRTIKKNSPEVTMNTPYWVRAVGLFLVLAVAAPATVVADNGLPSLKAQVVELRAMVLALQSSNATLMAQVADLQTRVATAEAGVIPGLKDYVTVDTATHTVLFTGADVQIVNGLGSTATLNGLGNLIVGYNEPRPVDLPFVCSDGLYSDAPSCENAGRLWAPNHKSGSHNIVGGSNNSYSSFGGLIVGARNVINNDFASVSGGDGNISSGYLSSVGGGIINVASGTVSSVSGGWGNGASGFYSSISGGVSNRASAQGSSVSGGATNIASAPTSSVSGGNGNIASGTHSSVSGGRDNQARGGESSVSGGFTRSTSDPYNWVAGELFQDR